MLLQSSFIMITSNLMKTNETLSAFMDGEVTSYELDKLLSSIENNQSMLTTWYRYHVVRSVLRKEGIEVQRFERANIISIFEEKVVQ